MATEAVAEFTINGRAFTVLWKPSATYLHGDGRMWEVSLDENLTREEAIQQARLQAEEMLEEERLAEAAEIYKFYLCWPPARVRKLKSGYKKMAITVDGQPFPVVWVTFNQNIYACLWQGWHFVGNAADPDTALVAAQTFIANVAARHRRPGQPNSPQRFIPDGLFSPDDFRPAKPSLCDRFRAVLRALGFRAGNRI